MEVLVAIGWLLTVTGIGILSTDNPAPLDDRYGKVTAMAIILCGFCWLSARRID